jgi:Predicted membrane protein (DUF2142)
MGIVRVPAWVTDLADPLDVILDSPICPTINSCHVGPPLGMTSTRTIVSATQFSNYPPLYYLLVGWPTLIASGTGALYGMRLLVVLFDSALIALGLCLLARFRRRSILVGSLFALPPMALFVCSVVNANGMEIAAGFAAWCGGLCIAATKEPPRHLVIWTSLAFVILIFSRPDSPAYAIGIIAVLGLLAGWKRCREVAKQLRVFWMSLVGALVVAGCFLLFVGAPTPLGLPENPPLSLISGVWLTVRLMGDQSRQIVGDFGWLDIPAPLWVVMVWVIALIGLVAWALTVSRRARRALPLLALGLLACPFVFETPLLNSAGPGWQGRYWLPLAIGLPLVAGAVLDLRQRSAIIVGLVLGAAQVGALLSVLHAYDGHTVRPGSYALWGPPGGAALTLAIFVVGQVLLVAFAWGGSTTIPNPKTIAAIPSTSTSV